MPDRSPTSRPTDSSPIDIGSEYQIRYWTNALGVSVGQLRAAVAEAGSQPRDFRQWLADRGIVHGRPLDTG